MAKIKYGVSVAVFPTSWELGYARVRRKDVLAVGPVRLSIHRVEGSLHSYGKN